MRAQLEEDLVRARVSRKWYLVVIVLLYIGLLASFSLNVTLLMRKPVTTITLPPDTQVIFSLWAFALQIYCL